LWIEAERGVGRKKAKITLAAGISGWSAADIARIAFDPVAWHSAQLVGNSLSAARISRQPFYPKAHFPFDGKTTLRASGVWLPFCDDPAGTFLVYRLLSCSHRFPFRGLEYGLAGQAALAGGSKGGFSEKSSSMHVDDQPQTFPVHAKRIGKNFVEADPSKKLGTAEIVIEKAAQFPDLRFKSVRRVVESVPPETHIQLLPEKPIVAASVGTDGKDEDDAIRPVDLVRHLEWGKSGIEPLLVMRDLVVELSDSGKFDKVEMVSVNPDEEGKILTSFGEAVWRFNGGAWSRSLRKRLPVFLNIQIALATKGSVVAFLLIAGINHTSKISQLCVAVKPHSFKMTWSIAEDVVVALNLPRIPYSEVMTDHDISPHFIPVPRMAINRNLSKIVRHLRHQVELFCDIY
jgi:hypothetical protein